MGAKDAVLKKLRSTKSALPASDPWEQKKAEWVADLHHLMSMIAGWLADARQEGLLSLEEKKIQLGEEDLGPYEVPTLEIQTLNRNPRKVHVVPRGMRIVGFVSKAKRLVGAEGRVDILSGPARSTLLRKRTKGATTWNVVLQDGSTAPLDEEAFFKVFNEFLE